MELAFALVCDPDPSLTLRACPIRLRSGQGLSPAKRSRRLRRHSILFSLTNTLCGPSKACPGPRRERGDAASSVGRSDSWTVAVRSAMIFGRRSPAARAGAHARLGWGGTYVKRRAM
jgi:hypothetical protein